MCIEFFPYWVFILRPNENFIYNCNHCSCTLFLTSYSLYKQVMLIWILIDVQYLQNIVFSFEKGSNGQNHSLSDSHPRRKKSPSKISNSPFWSGIPLPLTLFGKPWYFTNFTYFRKELILDFNLIFCVEIAISI